MTVRAPWLAAATAVLTLAQPSADVRELLLNPAALTKQAPDTFQAAFDTSAGVFVIAVHREWAPNGADRFYNLVAAGFYDGNRFFRVVPLMAVWGIHGDPEVAKTWLSARIPNDPTHQHGNTKGTIAFLVASGRRTTQTFLNLVDNPGFDVQISPFGEVVSGMDVVQKLYAGYGEAKPNGSGPELTPYYEEGNAYLERGFPKLDYIKKATIVP